jgi:hypothetical protein
MMEFQQKSGEIGNWGSKAAGDSRPQVVEIKWRLVVASSRAAN